MNQFDHKSLCLIAQQTKIRQESLSETLGLHRRDLLFSEDYSKILFTIYNDVTIKDVLANINYLFLLRNNFRSKIIVCYGHGNSDFEFIYKLFSNLYNKIFLVKRYLKLQELIEREEITKFIYNKSYYLFKENATKPLIGSVHVDYDSMIRMRGIVISSSTKANCISAKDDILAAKYIKQLNLNDSVVINNNDSVKDNLGIVLGSTNYINIHNNSVMDHLVPFLGQKILAYQTSMYDNELFVNSSSILNSRVKRI